jgi:hypothetical protein
MGKARAFTRQHAAKSKEQWLLELGVVAAAASPAHTAVGCVEVPDYLTCGITHELVRERAI